MAIWITPGAAWRPADALHHSHYVGGSRFSFSCAFDHGAIVAALACAARECVSAYRLYAVSNIGSLLGLLSFPVLFEPLFRVKVLGILWSVGFEVFCICCAWCAWQSTGLEEADRTRKQIESADHPQGIAVWMGLLWATLAGTASALMLATTNLLCQEIISLSLLWVVPLALYLVSFILCFDHPRWYRREVFQPLFVLGVFVLSAALVYAERTRQIIVMPLLLFVSCMICHGELVRLKPDVSRLTMFYLAVSAGGACGGIFVVVIAPHIFRFFTEFQMALGACALLAMICLFLDAKSWIHEQSFWLTAGIAVGTVVAIVALGQWIPLFGKTLELMQFYAWAFVALTRILCVAYILREKSSGAQPFRMAQVVSSFVVLLILFALFESSKPEQGLILGERNFYGAVRVYALPLGGKALFYAQTMHGAQLNPPDERLPITYYGPQSGIGVPLQNDTKRNQNDGSMRVGIAGLGAGTLAAYHGGCEVGRRAPTIGAGSNERQFAKIRCSGAGRVRGRCSARALADERGV